MIKVNLFVTRKNLLEQPHCSSSIVLENFGQDSKILGTGKYSLY